MNSVTVSKAALLEKIKANRARHLDIFQRAQVEYRKQVIEELDNMLAEAKSGRRIRRSVQLVEPVCQLQEYDRAIAMLEMCVEEVIEISEQDFSCFVLDRWRWRDQFIASSSNYVADFMEVVTEDNG